MLVTQMKKSKRQNHSNVEFKKMPYAESIPFAVSVTNFDDEGDDGDKTKIVSQSLSSINVDNIETEGACTVASISASIVRSCDTDVSYQNKTDDLHGYSQNS